MKPIPARNRRLTRRRLALMLGAAALLLVLCAIAGLCLGPRTLSPVVVLQQLLLASDAPLRPIITQLRLPRVCLAMGAGGALAVCGALFQALLRNPLAEPYILGVSNGCAVGVILGFLLGIGGAGSALAAFAGGAAVTLSVLGISRGSRYGQRSESMLLAGVMVAAIGASLIFLLLHLLGPNVRSAVQWMLGDLSTATVSIGVGSGILFSVLLTASLFSGNAINALAMGQSQAASLGLNVRRAQTGVYLLGSLIVGVTVSFCGAIGFVGLVVPHILRRLTGADHRSLLPLSVIVGGAFLVLCDAASRTVPSLLGDAGSELPIGAVTALVGAPVFIALLRSRR